MSPLHPRINNNKQQFQNAIILVTVLNVLKTTTYEEEKIVGSC